MGRKRLLPAPLLAVWIFAASAASDLMVAHAASEPDYLTLTADPVLVRYVKARETEAREVASLTAGSIERLCGEMNMPGPRGPIRIDLPPAGREPWPGGSRVPDWVAGYAVPERGTVVLVAGREPGYPDRSIRSLLDHELSHVLMHRATLGRPLPRWFEEGAAIHFAREWRPIDTFHSSFGTIFLGTPRLALLSKDFSGGGSRAGAAYALSNDFIRFLEEFHGPEVVSEILKRVGDGKPFDQAFESVMGLTLSDAEVRWRRQASIRFRWVPVATSATTVWLGLTVLVLAAYFVKRGRSRRMLDSWETDEAGPLAQGGTSPGPRENQDAPASREETIH